MQMQQEATALVLLHVSVIINMLLFIGKFHRLNLVPLGPRAKSLLTYYAPCE
jgi:hypothetical protein